MGLDIYISRRVFIGAMYRSRVITGKIELFSNGKLIPIKQESVSSVTEELYHGSKTWWLWKWLEKEVPELLESNGAEHVISVDMLQKLCRVCGDISAVKGSDAFSIFAKTNCITRLEKILIRLFCRALFRKLNSLQKR